MLVMLRKAIDDSGWKHEALAAEMSKTSGHRINGKYLSRMLAGEKPWTHRHIAALPDDIEARFALYHAEALGLIVVPPVAREEAVRQLVAGLMGVLAPTTSRRYA